MKIDNKRNLTIKYFSCFIFTFAYRFFYILGPTVMRVTYDDIGIMCGPARLAGFDWSGTMHYIKYYGQSLSVFLTPFFLIFKSNPTAIWYSIQIFYICVAALGAVILFHIGRVYFKTGDSWIYVFFASLSTVAFEPNNDMSNEPALFISAIFATLFLLKMINENNRVRIIIFQILTLISIMFGYLANSRGMVFWAVIPVIYLWILWKYKGKQLGYWYVWIPGLIVALWGANRIRDWVILRLWNVDLKAGETIINTSAEISFDKIFEMLSCRSGIKVFLMSVFGGIYGSSIHSYGIILFLFVMVAFFLFTKREDNKNIAIEISALVGIGCFLVGLIGVSTSTLYGEGIWEDLQNNRVTVAYDGLYYYRYYASSIAPGLFAAMCWIPTCLKNSRKKWIAGLLPIVLFIPICVFNYMYVVEEAIKYDETRKMAMYPYVLKSVEEIPSQFWVCLVIMLLFIALYIGCVCFNCKWLASVGGALLIILPIVYASDRRPYASLMNDHCDIGYDLVHYLEDTDAKDTLGDTLHLAGESKTVINYQYALMEYKISEEIPIMGDAMVFANNNPELINESLGYTWIPLDNNESVYVRGDKLVSLIYGFLDEGKNAG